jgi:ABC-type branched-subunit amino acid transport system substrate-binding protein
MLRSEFLGLLAASGTITPGAPTVLQQSTIGVSVPLSGNLQNYGEEIVKGVRAAVDEQNRYSTLTRAYGVRTFDDQNNATIATSNIFTAEADSTIIGMVGNLTTEVTLLALPAYANASMPLVIPATTADVITTKLYRNIFRLPTKDSSEGQLFARAILEGRKPMRVIAVDVDGDYGYDVARAFMRQAQGDKHNADQLTLDATTSAKNAAAVILAKAPAYIFLAGKPDKLGPVAIELRAQGYTGEFGCSDGFYTTTTIDTYAKPLNGAIVASSMPPLDRIPSVATYLPDFRNEVGAITGFSAYGYAAAQLLIQASQRANATNRLQVLNELEMGGSYTLLIGQFQFTFGGDAAQPNIYLFRVTTGGFTYEQAALPSGFVV